MTIGCDDHLTWIVAPDAPMGSKYALRWVLDAIDGCEAPVLVLPTGRTPELLYTRLAAETSPTRWHAAHVFCLDEYVGLAPDDPRSFASYMRRFVFDPLRIPAGQRHVPDGLAGADAPSASSRETALADAAEAYEASLERLGPADIAVLGVGVNGHIGFNEPGSALDSRTRVVSLTAATQAANAGGFPDGDVPSRAITMGIGTILDARRILLLAWGVEKHAAIERLASGDVDRGCPVSALHLHDDVTVVVDSLAAWGVDW